MPWLSCKKNICRSNEAATDAIATTEKKMYVHKFKCRHDLFALRARWACDGIRCGYVVCTYLWYFLFRNIISVQTANIHISAYRKTYFVFECLLKMLWPTGSDSFRNLFFITQLYALRENTLVNINFYVRIDTFRQT